MTIPKCVHFWDLLNNFPSCRCSPFWHLMERKSSCLSSKNSFQSLLTAHCQISPKIWPFLPCFSRQNWQVIFEVFYSNFGFAWLAWLNSSTRSLVWENERNCWEMFTSSLRSHKFKSGNISWYYPTVCNCVLCYLLVFQSLFTVFSVVGDPLHTDWKFWWEKAWFYPWAFA